MNNITALTWRGSFCVFLLSALTACATPHSAPPMLGSHPWPTDSEGRAIQGTTTVMALVNYHGLPVAACIDTSSGNSMLDEEAIRRVGRMTFHPELVEGRPINGYARLPITFSLSGQASVDTTAGHAGRHRVCDPQPIAGVPAAEFAVAQNVHLHVAPTQDGLVPGTDKKWPLDERDKFVHIGATEQVLVDASGHMIKSGTLISYDVDKFGYDRVNPAHDPARFAGFVQAASSKLSTFVFAAGNEQHWQLVDVDFGG